MKRSLLDEIEDFIPAQNKFKVLEMRCSNAINSVIHVLEMLEENLTEEEYEIIEQKLLLAIKRRDESKCVNKLKVIEESRLPNKRKHLDL